MTEIKQTRQQLERRREEIYARLERVNRELQTELDPDAEEQAIQIEQSEVSVAMEANLRKELSEIEDKLAEMDEAV